MYCPSCDKSYGAVHSRCPECHSWLKVSAPSNHRSKSAKAASASGASGVVSTLEKEPSWPDAPASAPSAWGSDGSDSWSDALPPAPSPQSFPSLDPAPAAQGGWGGGGSWGEEASSSVESDWSGAKGPASPSLSSASTPSLGGGWLGGADSDSHDGWGGASGGLSAPKPSPVSVPQSRGLGANDDDGWGGGSSSLGSVSSSPSTRDDWGASSSPSLGSSSSSSGGGWLGDADDEPSLGSPASESAGASSGGWLSGGSRETHSESSDGWLGGEESARAPSMTEMVDHAIGVEEADDFVDESWVDDEIGDFEGLGVDVAGGNEYAPPSPEVAHTFLKMLLVAALVLLVGGGIMYMGKEEKTPEQIKAEERAKELEFARSSVIAGQTYMKEGKPLLAVGPLTAAMTSLKTSGAPQEEVLAAKADLARALMKSQDYEKAYDQWVGLVKGPEKYRKEAVAGRDEASRTLRAQANAELAESAKYFQMGESSSLLIAGEKALKIFEKHQGTASQKGKAIGVIGRGYLNGKEYGKAKDYLRKAQRLNPAGGYEADLREIASRTTPVDYYGSGYSGGGYSEPASAAPSQPIQVNASIESDGGYVKSQNTYHYTPRQAAPAPAQAAPAPVAQPRVQQPVAPPRRNSSPQRSSGGRKGDRDVLPGYNTRR